MKRSFLLFILIGSLAVCAQAQTSQENASQKCQKIKAGQSATVLKATNVSIEERLSLPIERASENEAEPAMSAKESVAAAAAIRASLRAVPCCEKADKKEDCCDKLKASPEALAACEAKAKACEKKEKAKKQLRPSATVKLVKN